MKLLRINQEIKDVWQVRQKQRDYQTHSCSDTKLGEKLTLDEVLQIVGKLCQVSQLFNLDYPIQ